MTVFFATLLISVLIFFVSILLMLFRSKRKIAKKGMLFGLAGSFVSLVAFTVTLEELNKPGFFETKDKEPITSAELEPEKETPVAVKEKWETLGFKNIKEFAEAAKIGISNPKAYDLRKDKDVIKPFCSYAKKSYQISDEANARVQKANDNQSKIQKAFKWEEENQVALRADLLKQIHLTDSEIIILSGAMHWQLYCDAYDKNLHIIDRDLASRTSEEWADKAKRGIRAYFNWRLENTRSTFFDREKYSTANCNQKKIDGLFYVACKLHSLSASTRTIYFIVARGLGGKVLVAPLKYGHLAFDTNETEFEAYGEPKFYLSQYVARDDNYTKIRSEFGE